MAFFMVARRLARIHLSVSFLLHPSITLSSFSASSSGTLLCSAFHRTVSLHFQTPLTNPNLLTFHSFSNQVIHDSFGFTEPAANTCDPQVPSLLDLLKRVANLDSEAEAMASLLESHIEPSPDLVYSVIWALRGEWRIAFLAFKWGNTCGCSDNRVCELMVWILGNHGKFNTALCLIRDMYRSSMNPRRAMLIMIDRYAAANDPCKAIRTFHVMENFRLAPDEEAFRSLLTSLCKYGNIEEAEELMFVNKKLFPLNVDVFNIILNGWCNISLDLFEAKRVWREMSKCCLTPDAISYGHMISCFSKVGNLFDSLRLFDEMKKRGRVPGVEVYNSLFYVLTRENCFQEALKLLEKMKETGLRPDSATYNSMILPLCQAKEVEKARNVLATMIGENLSPTIETYHGFLKGVGIEGTFEVLNRMKIAGLGPNGDTFLLILDRLFNLQQPGNALKIWAEMKNFEVVADPAHYKVLVQGLAACGWLIKAKEFYVEMMSNGFADDPKLQKLLKEPVCGKNDNRAPHRKQVRRPKNVNQQRGSSLRLKKVRKTRSDESI